MIAPVQAPNATSNSQVGIARARDYEPGAVRAAVRDACARAGELFACVRPGTRVFVKPNHLGEHPPRRAVNTHPEILASVLEMLVDCGARITIGDCLDREGDRPFHTSGMMEACARFGIVPTNLREVDFDHVVAPGAVKVPAPLISRAAAEAEVIVNLPKLKSHLLATLTLGIKNMYGVFPHKVRHQYHREFPAYRDFAEMLVDLYSAVKPQITVMDGIIGLEGMGPGRKGTPRPIGVVLAAADGVALDAVATAIVGQNPRRIDTTRIAANRGLGVADLERITLAGATLEAVKVERFRIPTALLHATTLIDRLPPVAADLAHRAAMSVREVPRLLAEACTGCAECVAHCPEDAIAMKGPLPAIDLDSCVPCFACVNFCPESALERSWNPLGRAAMLAFDGANRVRRGVKRALGLRKD